MSIFQLITNDGEQDRVLMLDKLLIQHFEGKIVVDKWNYMINTKGDKFYKRPWQLKKLVVLVERYHEVYNPRALEVAWVGGNGIIKDHYIPPEIIQTITGFIPTPTVYTWNGTIPLQLTLKQPITPESYEKIQEKLTNINKELSNIDWRSGILNHLTLNTNLF